MTIRVYQDPGHGGGNRGAEREGIVEKTLTMDIARSCEDWLHRWPGITQAMSRDNDETISYHQRAEKAKGWGADIVFCHHVNVRQVAEPNPDYVAPTGDEVDELEGEPTMRLVDDPRASGLMTLVLEHDHIAFEVGRQINRSMAAGLEPARMLPHRARRDHWTERAYNILSLYAPIPVLILEWGYLSSSYDRASLLDPINRPAMATAMLAGVCRFLQLKERTLGYG